MYLRRTGQGQMQTAGSNLHRKQLYGEPTLEPDKEPLELRLEDPALPLGTAYCTHSSFTLTFGSKPKEIPDCRILFCD